MSSESQMIELEKAVRSLGNGGVVVFPTDTLYGLGADVFSLPALQRIFSIKGRPADLALPVLVADMDQLEAVALPMSSQARRLAQRFWPGPLTLVMHRSPDLPDLVTEGPNYNFAPYDYGPFDSTVYNDARVLQAAGLARIADASNGRWSTYSATDHGLERATEILGGMTKGQRKYILDVAAWVRKLSFSALVKSIYDAYPQMRERSIFEG
ncbi:MAG: Sua5/YciO/YrdC/YwlC family protein [Chloroflexi bacterium]|nr:Sua5/YciO/YrdC/YwlC family protein [Chloroflexota bacterium]